MRLSEENKNFEKNIRWEVFLPAFIFIVGAAILGIVNNKALAEGAMKFFYWCLSSFGWLFQISLMACFVLVFIVTFTKFGKLKIGGKNAQPKFSFGAWFVMALTAGISVGIETWGVNEPIIYFGSVWGELKTLGIQPKTMEAAYFAMGRVFYNWTFVPYAIYALCGLLVAYMYFHKRDQLTVTATLEPLFGKKVTSKASSAVVDTLSMLALTIGLTTGLTMCITLVMSGLKGAYGIKESLPLYIIIGILIIIAFTLSTYVGLDKGLAKIAKIKVWFYYGIMLLLLFTGSTLFILNLGTAGLAEWMHNFWRWGLDPGNIGGDALTQSWTLFDWAFWVGYAPVTGIFLAMISYGRTIREYMIINWILPSIFGMVWFTVWGGNAIHMQMTGKADLIGAINNGGAVSGLWAFLQHLPFGLGVIVVPITLFIILVSFVTNADATLVNIGSMCMRDVPIGTEPPAKIKVIWGISVGAIGIVMAAFGGGAQGVDGVKALAVVAGFTVLFVFVLQIIAFAKVFFVDKFIKEPDEPEDSLEQNF